MPVTSSDGGIAVLLYGILKDDEPDSDPADSEGKYGSALANSDAEYEVNNFRKGEGRRRGYKDGGSELGSSSDDPSSGTGESICRAYEIGRAELGSTSDDSSSVTGESRCRAYKNRGSELGSSLDDLSSGRSSSVEYGSAGP